MDDEEALWKKRFHIFAGVRLAGLAVFFLGIAIAYGDLLRDGGWMAVGMTVAALGLVDAVFAPMLLRKKWNRDE